VWIQLSDIHVDRLRRVLEDALLTWDDEVIKELTDLLDHFATPDANDQRFRDAVKTDDDLECDDDAITSPSELGAFVHTWTWVYNHEAGIEDDEESEVTR
jgi:hypothetical protein